MREFAPAAGLTFRGHIEKTLGPQRQVVFAGAKLNIN